MAGIQIQLEFIQTGQGINRLLVVLGKMKLMREWVGGRHGMAMVMVMED